MKPYSNAHTHSTFDDGKSSVLDTVRAAMKEDFVSLGFTIHANAPFDPETPSAADEAAFRLEIKRLSGLFGDLEILCGIERDILTDSDVSPYDYHLDSCHYLKRGDAYLCVDYRPELAEKNVLEYFSGDYYAYARAFFETEIEAFSKSSAAFAGHIDLVSKFNEGGKYFDMSDPRYTKPALDVVHCLTERGIPVEMNTGAISRGWRKTPYPAFFLLRAIREAKGEILINSDCHSAEALCCGFDLCADLAKEAGFEHILRLRRSGLEEFPLE